MFVPNLNFGSYNQNINSICCPVCQTNKISIYEPPQIYYPDYSIDGKIDIQIEIPFCCKNEHKGKLVFVAIKKDDNRFVNIAYCQQNEISYQEYINSAAWKFRADQAKERAGGRCQLCNKTDWKGTLHAHHRTYERLGHELPEDITVLCPSCHAKFHDKPERN